MRAVSRLYYIYLIRHFSEGDIGVCGIAVLANFSCGISVILMAVLRYSRNLRDAFSLRFGRRFSVQKRILHFLASIFSCF